MRRAEVAAGSEHMVTLSGIRCGGQPADPARFRGGKQDVCGGVGARPGRAEARRRVWMGFPSAWKAGGLTPLTRSMSR